MLNLGLAVSVLHLGRPLGAWRAFLGLRTSWMSREILGFSLFAGAAGAFVFVAMWPWLVAHVPPLAPLDAWLQPPRFASPLSAASAALALLGVFCSAMIYIDTRRAFWRRGPVFIKFFGTTLLLGAAGCAMILAWEPALADAARVCAILATLSRLALFGWEAADLRRSFRDREQPNHRSARVIWELCRPVVLARFGLFAAATLLGVLAFTSRGKAAAICAALAFALSFAVQLIERHFFFTAVVAPRMPGGVAA
jgi:formate dehydrogenase iron-sulfur subunit